MSGYLEVKHPSKSSLGLNPFKTWKKQWCTLRPSPTRVGGAAVVYCGAAGAAAGSVELPAGCAVRRAKSRSQPFAFAVFPPGDPRKPLILLAAQTLPEAQLWMDKIKLILSGNKVGTDTVLRSAFSVVISATELSLRRALAPGAATAALSPRGLSLAGTGGAGAAFVPWGHIAAVALEDDRKTCVVSVQSEAASAAGALRLQSAAAAELATALRRALRDTRRRSRSDCARSPARDSARRDTWCSQTSASSDDLDLASDKVPAARLARCDGASRRLVGEDGMIERRSLMSIASGIYEEIPDLPALEPAVVDQVDGIITEVDGGAPETDGSALDVSGSGTDGSAPEADGSAAEADGSAAEADGSAAEVGGIGGDCVDGLPRFVVDLVDSTPTNLDILDRLDEPTYESVAECVYATMRRAPPPLPPRAPPLASKLGWEGVTRHSSLGALPRCGSVGSAASDGSGADGAPDGGADGPDGERRRTLPRRQPFSVFRKRLKSDSRLAAPKDGRESKPEEKKKKFDFPPPRDLFRNFRKRSPKAKALSQVAETRSCECLDAPTAAAAPAAPGGPAAAAAAAAPARAASADPLDDSLELEVDLCLYGDEKISLPKDIVEAILKGREQLASLRLRPAEDAYTPMAAAAPPPPDQLYIVMSPRARV